MPVRADEDQTPAVEVRGLWTVDVDDLQRNPRPGRGRRDRRGVRRRGAEADQHEPAADRSSIDRPSPIQQWGARVPGRAEGRSSSAPSGGGVPSGTQIGDFLVAELRPKLFRQGQREQYPGIFLERLTERLPAGQRGEGVVGPGREFHDAFGDRFRFRLVGVRGVRRRPTRRARRRASRRD